jgi:hypothetical protein
MRTIWRSPSYRCWWALGLLVTIGAIFGIDRLPQSLQSRTEPTPIADTVDNVDAAVVASNSGRPYAYGILPDRADINDARRAYTAWKDLYVQPTNVPDPDSMLRVLNRPSGEGVTTSEYQGYGMLFAAHLEADDTVLEKLWNYTEHYLNDEGLMKWHIDQEGFAEYQQSALDGDVDIAIALDYAARRWPGRGWEERAETYINSILIPGKRSYLRTKPIDTDEWPRWKTGVYLNYLATAYMARFSDRTGDDLWVDIAMPNTYALLDYSYDHFVLPAWHVDAEGHPIHPNDPWNSDVNRHDRGATRTDWRIATHYLVSGHPDALRWVEKLTDFFYDAGHYWGANNTGEFAPDHLRIGYRFMTTDDYRAGEPYGNRREISETMIVAAGVPAMAAGQVEMTNKIYDFLVTDPIDGDDIPMDNAMHVMGLLIMSGGLDAVR